MRNGINVIGESKDDVIIRVDGTIMPSIDSRDKSGLFATVNTNISNLTIDVNDVKYCVHNDAKSISRDGYEAIFTNCKFIHRGTTPSKFSFPVGIGARRNQINKFIDCEFEIKTPDTEGCDHGVFWHNWNNQRDCAELQIINCKFINCGIVDLADLGSTQIDKVFVENCITNSPDKGIYLRVIPGYYRPHIFAKPVFDATLIPYCIRISTKGCVTKIYSDPVLRPLGKY